MSGDRPVTPNRKAGNSKPTAAMRRKLFAEEFLSNGQNAAQAALKLGVAAKNAHKEGYRYLHTAEVQALIATRSQAVAKAAEMSTERWARELQALAFADIGDLVGPDGRLLPIAELPPHVRAAISSIEVDTAGAVKYKFWSKTAALETMAKHLGLFEKDNSQRQPDVRVQVVLVG